MSLNLPMLRRGEACTECRRRKLRCNGAKPYCINCVRANRECRYEKIITRPVHVVLQERLAKLERKFRRLTGTSESEPSTPHSEEMSIAPGQGGSSNLATPATPQLPPPFSDAGDRWWEAESLPDPIRDFLINVFSQNCDKIHVYQHLPSFLTRVNAEDIDNQPHPALMEAIYLLACYFLSQDPQYSGISAYEFHFLTRARSALTESLSFSDRLLDFVRGSVLVSLYLFMRGRFLEGYHVHCGTARFALSCGLHRIRSSVWTPDMSSTASNILLLPPPSDQIELGERILSFWMIYMCDKYFTVIAGFVSALPGELDQTEAMDAVFPRTIEEYATGGISAADDETLREVIQESRTGGPGSGKHRSDKQEAPFATYLKALSLLDSATRLGAVYRLGGPTDAVVESLNKIQLASHSFITTLPPLSVFGSLATAGQPMTSVDVDTFVAHTTALGALMEINNTMIGVDNTAYDASLACAKSIAEIAQSAQNVLTFNEELTIAGYCWCLAAEVLIQNIQTTQEREGTFNPEDHDHQLANCIVGVIESFSAVFPSLVQQFKQVQQALGRSGNPA